MMAPAASGTIRVAHLVIGANSRLWSTFWCVKIGSSRVFICPEIASIGVRSRKAQATPLTRLVEPGPRVDMHTPGKPVSWP